MLKNKLSKYLIGGGMALVGLTIGIATIAGAQSITTKAPENITPTVTTQAVDTPEPGDVADTVENESVDTPEVGDKADVAGEHADKAGDKDGDAVSEANETAGSTDAGE